MEEINNNINLKIEEKGFKKLQPYEFKEFHIQDMYFEKGAI